MVKIAIDEIVPSTFNVREDYDLESIDVSNGIIQKPVVRRVLHGYEIIFGHRRIEALRHSGVNEVDVDIRDDYTIDEILIIQGKENLQRKNWKPNEEAKYFKLIIEQGKNIEYICESLNLKRRYVEQRLELLDKLHPELVPRTVYATGNQEKDDYLLTFTKARSIMKLEPEEQMTIVDRIQNDGLTTKQVTQLIKKVETIREKLWHITDDEAREKLLNMYEPIIYEDIVTLDAVNLAIVAALGIDIWTCEELKMGGKLVKSMEKFIEMYPDSCEYEEGKEDGVMWINFTLRIDTKLYAIVNEVTS